MKKTLKLFAVCIMTLSIVLLSFASMVRVDNTKYVHDLDGLISQEDSEALETRAAEFSRKYNMPMVIVITDDSMGRDPKIFADEFYEQNEFAPAPEKTGMILLIDMDSREIDVEVYGNMVDVFTDYDVDWILDSVFDVMVEEGSIYLTADEYITRSTEVMESWVTGSVAPGVLAQDDSTSLSVTPQGALIGGTTASSIAMGVLMLMHKKTLPSSMSADRYVDRSKMKYKVHQDRFLDTRTTRTRINRDNNSGGSGGFSGGRMSSGGSTSMGTSSRGGSRKF